MLCSSLDRQRVWGRKDTCICTAGASQAALVVTSISISRSVLSDSLQPHELYSLRLLCPWDSPGKNTGVGCCFLLQGTNSGIKPRSPTLQADSLLFEPLGKLCLCRRHKRCGFDHWARKSPWRSTWQPTPVFLPGEFHGHESLAGATVHSVTKSQN